MANSAPPSGDSLLEMFNRHRKALLRYIGKKMSHAEDAEDVVQETFVRLWHREGNPDRSLSTMAAPEAYMYRTASNLMIDRLRQQQARVDEGDRESYTDTVPGNSEPLQQLLDHERLAQLRAAVQSLPPKCRQVFVLHKYRQMTYQEVAEHLDISTSMVEKHMMKALTRLDLQLGDRS